MRKYKTFWHRINEYDQLYIQEHSGMTIGQFMKKFKQPDWCDYPDALQGIFGCWSLYYRYIHNIGNCENCNLCRILK